MLELLKEMDDDTYERMIAAYAIGITIAVAACSRAEEGHDDRTP